MRLRSRGYYMAVRRYEFSLESVNITYYFSSPMKKLTWYYIVGYMIIEFIY